MEVSETDLNGVLIIKPQVFGDKRGFFKEIYHSEKYLEAGINLNFIQDNYSRSTKGVLRGMHYQKTKPQGKLIQCLRGEIFDVIVDINKESKTFGRYISTNLTEDNHVQVYIPPGYAHGFCVLSDTAEISYKCTEFYYPEDEAGLAWDDPDVAISWPFKNPILSEKDKHHPNLKNL